MFRYFSLALDEYVHVAPPTTGEWQHRHWSCSDDKLLLWNTIRFSLDNNNDDKNKPHAVPQSHRVHTYPTWEVLYLRLAPLRFLFPVTVALACLIGGALSSRIANNNFVTLALLSRRTYQSSSRSALVAIVRQDPLPSHGESLGMYSCRRHVSCWQQGHRTLSQRRQA